MVHPTNREPVWRQIALAMEKDVDEGVFEPGERLPTENELATRFAVNRHTVRRAMSSLQEMGKVRIEQGRGTFVQSDVIEYSIGERTRYTQNISGANRMPTKTLLRADTIRSDSLISRNLNIRKGALVVVLEAISEADGRPVGVGTHYFPAKRFEAMIPSFTQTLSITEALRACGVSDYKRFSTRITATMPTRQQAMHLKQPPTRPVLQTESINVDLDGRTIEYGVSYFASDRTQLIVESEPLDDHAVIKK